MRTIARNMHFPVHTAYDSPRCECHRAHPVTARCTFGGRMSPGIVDGIRALPRPRSEFGVVRQLFGLLTLGETITQLKGLADSVKSVKTHSLCANHVD